MSVSNQHPISDFKVTSQSLGTFESAIKEAKPSLVGSLLGHEYKLVYYTSDGFKALSHDEYKALNKAAITENSPPPVLVPYKTLKEFAKIYAESNGVKYNENFKSNIKQLKSEYLKNGSEIKDLPQLKQAFFNFIVDVKTSPINIRQNFETQLKKSYETLNKGIENQKKAISIISGNQNKIRLLEEKIKSNPGKQISLEGEISKLKEEINQQKEVINKNQEQINKIKQEFNEIYKTTQNTPGLADVKKKIDEFSKTAQKESAQLGKEIQDKFSGKDNILTRANQVCDVSTKSLQAHATTSEKLKIAKDKLKEIESKLSKGEGEKKLLEKEKEKLNLQIKDYKKECTRLEQTIINNQGNVDKIINELEDCKVLTEILPSLNQTNKSISDFFVNRQKVEENLAKPILDRFKADSKNNPLVGYCSNLVTELDAREVVALSEKKLNIAKEKLNNAKSEDIPKLKVEIKQLEEHIKKQEDKIAKTKETRKLMQDDLQQVKLVSKNLISLRVVNSQIDELEQAINDNTIRDYDRMHLPPEALTRWIVTQNTRAFAAAKPGEEPESKELFTAFDVIIKRDPQNVNALLSMKKLAFDLNELIKNPDPDPLINRQKLASLEKQVEDITINGVVKNEKGQLDQNIMQNASHIAKQALITSIKQVNSKFISPEEYAKKFESSLVAELKAAYQNAPKIIAERKGKDAAGLPPDLFPNAKAIQRKNFELDDKLNSGPCKQIQDSISTIQAVILNDKMTTIQKIEVLQNQLDEFSKVTIVKSQWSAMTQANFDLMKKTLETCIEHYRQPKTAVSAVQQPQIPPSEPG